MTKLAFGVHRRLLHDELGNYDVSGPKRIALKDLLNESCSQLATERTNEDSVPWDYSTALYLSLTILTTIGIKSIKNNTIKIVLSLRYCRLRRLLPNNENREDLLHLLRLCRDSDYRNAHRFQQRLLWQQTNQTVRLAEEKTGGERRPHFHSCRNLPCSRLDRFPLYPGRHSNSHWSKNELWFFS